MSVSDVVPQLRLDVGALEHNLAVMQDWCDERGLTLAPHVKTSMSSQVVRRQLAVHGPTVTVATAAQAEQAVGWGASTVLVANQVLDAAGLRRLRALTEDDRVRRLWCLVDSEEGARRAAGAFAGAGTALEVLLEVGHAGGRAGVRTADEAGALAAEVRGLRGLRLAGVAGYEGTGPNVRDPERLDVVDELCALTVRVFGRLARDGALGEAPVVTLGGSAFPDRAASALATVADVPGAVRLLRSGCYATHDHGTYARVSPVPGLRAALSIRTLVQSAPEPGFAVLATGKRDVAYDAGMPVVLAVHDPRGELREGAGGEVVSLYDHHAVVRGTGSMRVGDVVDLGISHPCSVLDRWDRYLAVHPDGRTEVWTTHFGRG